MFRSVVILSFLERSLSLSLISSLLSEEPPPFINMIKLVVCTAYWRYYISQQSMPSLRKRLRIGSSVTLSNTALIIYSNVGLKKLTFPFFFIGNLPFRKKKRKEKKRKRHLWRCPLITNFCFWSTNFELDSQLVGIQSMCSLRFITVSSCLYLFTVV